ncbi:hypothetical protein NXZ55_13830 [Escherichia coli]|nr:hypothetical protein [Escherichia coli]
MSIKNDGHYFCRAGGNRPDGLNEPVTMNHPVIGVVTKADLASMEQTSLVKCWLREAGAHNVLVTSAVNNNGVTEVFALLHTEEGCR